MSDLRKLALWECITWYTMALNTEYEKRERKVLDQAIDAALAGTVDEASKNDQTVRAREQAGGLEHWANVLEAHEPESSAAGIVMLREAAKTLRRFADAPPEPTEEMVEAAAYELEGLKPKRHHVRRALEAALAAAQPEKKEG